MEDSLRGKLLIASPALLDPNFARTVVFITEHNDEGAMGIVLNRPSETSLESVVPQLAEIAGGEPIYIGGPVQPEALVLLADFSNPEAAAWVVVADVAWRLPTSISTSSRMRCGAGGFTRVIRAGARASWRRRSNRLVDSGGAASGRAVPGGPGNAVERRAGPKGGAIRADLTHAGRPVAKLGATRPGADLALDNRRYGNPAPAKTHPGSPLSPSSRRNDPDRVAGTRAGACGSRRHRPGRSATWYATSTPAERIDRTSRAARQTIEPFIRMCHERAKESGSRKPASSASRRTTDRMFSRCRRSPGRRGARAHLEQHVDERAGLEVVAPKPLVEDVEDRQQLILWRGAAALASASTQPRVQSCSRRSRKASTRSSLEGKCR